MNQNTLGSAFERIVDANSRYYVLGYYPPTSARDGRFHQIEVRTKRPGLRVSARRGYASPRRPHARRAKARRRDTEGTRGQTRRRQQHIARAARRAQCPLQQSGLTFTVQAAPFKLSQKEASVALAIEFDAGSLPFTAPDSSGVVTNTIELTFFGINQDGKAQRSTRTQFNLTLRPESFARVKAGGLRLNPRLTLEPGRYQIRVGARESVGSRVGTVFYDLLVPDFRKAPLMLSGVLITAGSAQSGMTALPDAAGPNLLPGPAVSRRTFARNDTVTVFAEIYDNSSSRQPRQIETAMTSLPRADRRSSSARDSLGNPSVPAEPAATVVGRHMG